MNEEIKEITRMRNDPQLHFNPIFPPFDFFLHALGNIAEGKKEYPVLSYFVANRTKLRLVKHLPFLVQCYRWMQNAFSHAISKKESLKITIAEAIEKLPNSKKEWETFKKLKQVWSELRDALTIVVCGGAGEDAVAEIPALKVDSHFNRFSSMYFFLGGFFVWRAYNS